MNIPLEFIAKKRGGRSPDFDTLKTFCKTNKHNTPTIWFRVSKSIKLPESDDIFGHVAIGNLNDTQVVVKVYGSGCRMLKAELNILKNLNKHGICNIVRRICDFECSNENKLLWEKPIQRSRSLCNEQKKKTNCILS